MWPSRHVSSWTVRHKSWLRRWRKVIRLLWQPEICKESTFWYILILLWWGWTDTFDQISQLSGAEVVNRWYQEISFHDFHSEAPNSRSGKSPRNSDKENSQTRQATLANWFGEQARHWGLAMEGLLQRVIYSVINGSNSQGPKEWEGGGGGNLRPPGQHWGMLCRKCAKHLYLLICGSHIAFSIVCLFYLQVVISVH